VTEGRGYSEKTLQDIHAAATGRIGSLLRGSKGRMLNTRRPIPLDELMARPTVLELEALNDEEKALVMLFLLTLVRERCRATRGSSKLQHVTLVEEAHRVVETKHYDGNEKWLGTSYTEETGEGTQRTDHYGDDDRRVGTSYTAETDDGTARTDHYDARDHWLGRSYRTLLDD
jgi:hypothetical protein